MVKIKSNNLLKIFLLIFIYTVISFFILFNLPKYTYAKEEEGKKPHAKMEYNFSETDINVVYFDGSGSSDKDGTIVSYSWDFGDGSTGSDVNTTHTYSAPGKYRVVLTVTDNDGLQNTCNKNINIKSSEDTDPEDDKNPQAKMEYNFSDMEIVYFDGSGSFDTDGTIIYYHWDFGDGSTGSGATVTHTYSAPGNYRVVLTVTDNDGLQNTCNKNVKIESRKPHAKMEYNFSETDTNVVYFDGSGSSDKDGTIVSYRWDFGDVNTGKGTTATHTYSAPGNYRVVLTVTDNDGLQNTCNKNINIKPKENKKPEEDVIVDIENKKPEEDVIVVIEDEKPEEDKGADIKDEKPEVNIKPQVKMEYNFLNTYTVPFDGSGSFDTDGTIIYYHWDFGDGSTGSGAAATHTYSAPGKYHVVLTVTDNDGFISRTTRIIYLQSNSINDTDNKNTENFLQSENEEQIEDPGNDQTEFNDEPANPVKEPDNFIFKINKFFKNLFNVKKDKIADVLDIDINNISDLLDIQKITENHDIIEVIEIDEIIDLNYEKDINKDREIFSTKKYPEFISNFWNKFIEIVTLYS